MLVKSAAPAAAPSGSWALAATTAATRGPFPLALTHFLPVN